MLDERVAWPSQGVAEGVGDPQHPRRLGPFGVFLDEHDPGGADSGFLEAPGKHADRVRAEGSSGGQQHHLHALVQHLPRHFRPGLVVHP